MLVLLTLPVPVRGLNVAVMAALAVVSLAVGLVTWLIPWDRWPRRASLVLVLPAFALIALANAYGLANLQPYGVFFLVAFVWLGIAHPPRMSVAVAPLAALAYVLPLLYLHASAGARVYATVLTIPLCVLVAEGIGWAAAKLERMEIALQREKGRTERLRELDELKDNFLSSVSHELRNPITICRGHLEVMEDGASRQEVRAVKETLINELDLMARLVTDLTTRARVDDREQLRIERLPLDQFVTSIAKKATPILGHRLKIEYDVPEATLRADPQRLSQALLNLLRNAAEHAQREGPVRLQVLAETESWRFEVADEGGGLVPGHERVVFEPFRTGSPVTGGTGLGLSIVRGIARAHGGDSGVINRPGRGATFWIRIPR
jgi:signal transduction histidine kinase